MSLDTNFVRNTNFLAGFNFMGKRTTNVGEDLLTATGIDTATTDGTPLVFNGDIDTVAVAGDGVKPDAYLYSRISEKLTDAEWMLTDIVRDEVKPGDPFTIILHKDGGIIETNLVDSTTLGSSVGTDVFVNSGEFSVTDPATDSPIVGTLIEIGTDKVKILLK